MPNHEQMTDPAFATMDDAPRDGLMALVHSTQERGFGIGILPDESDLAGTCFYSSERLTRILAEWAEHNLHLANVVTGLPRRKDYEALEAKLDALHLDVMNLQTLAKIQQQTIDRLTGSSNKAAA